MVRTTLTKPSLNYSTVMKRAFHASAGARSRGQNHYQVLGVGVNASPKEIKKQFYALSKEYHPDKHGDAELKKYQQITEAYAVLSDTTQRKVFDQTLGTAVRRPEGYKAPASRRPWQGTSRGSSGFKFHDPLRAKPAHAERRNPDLDPLRPRAGHWERNDDVSHFSFDQHLRKQERYAAHRSNQAAELHKARMGAYERADQSRQSGRQVSSGSHLLGIFAGGAAAVVTLGYLLFR